MKKYFLSYHFVSRGANGFGDMDLEGDGIHSMADIAQAKTFIKEHLEKNGCPDATVVIINWREFEPAGAERKAP